MVKALRSPVSEPRVSAPRGRKHVRCTECRSHVVIWFQCWQRYDEGTDIWYLVDDYRCLNCGNFISLSNPITIIPPTLFARGRQLDLLDNDDLS